MQTLFLRCYITLEYLFIYLHVQRPTKLITILILFGPHLFDICWLNHKPHLIVTIMIMYFYKTQENYIRGYV